MCILLLSLLSSILSDSLAFSIITLHVYKPSSPSMRYEKCRVLLKMLAKEFVGLMATLLLFVIEIPSGPNHWKITELGSTPLNVISAVHWISIESPTATSCSELINDTVTENVGTTRIKGKWECVSTYNCYIKDILCQMNYHFPITNFYQFCLANILHNFPTMG